jgi:hypothetical protein
MMFAVLLNRFSLSSRKMRMASIISPCVYSPKNTLQYSTRYVRVSPVTMPSIDRSIDRQGTADCSTSRILHQFKSEKAKHPVVPLEFNETFTSPDSNKPKFPGQDEAIQHVERSNRRIANVVFQTVHVE